jgi:hypothetical protein
MLHVRYDSLGMGLLSHYAAPLRVESCVVGPLPRSPWLSYHNQHRKGPPRLPLPKYSHSNLASISTSYCGDMSSCRSLLQIGLPWFALGS